MEWRDEGLILGVRRHGETSVILEAMTSAHGRHLGLVRGGRSRRMQPFLQAGNNADLTWRARLDEHLGTFSVEPAKVRTAQLMDSAEALHAIGIVASLLRLIAERDPHPRLFEIAMLVAEHIGDPRLLPALLVRFEVEILAETGFGLDLGSCAATGVESDLVYVSPKSGRAVSKAAGEAYRDRLLRLPAFLLEESSADSPPAEIRNGFALTGFFLTRDLYAPRGLALPQPRAAYLAELAKRPGWGGSAT
jgi:DNA repair protein RecO (recombination protein O)